jgi:hypothetical protein
MAEQGGCMTEAENDSNAIAQNILRMIETVDPSDTAKLDEIDARVWCLLHNKTLHCMSVYPSYYQEGKEYSSIPMFIYHDISDIEHHRFQGERCLSDVPQYTRSRDALKAIRPKGWTFKMYGDDGSGQGIRATLTKWQMGHGTMIIDAAVNAWLIGKTEELAELHAVIQAIAHERGVTDATA